MPFIKINLNPKERIVGDCVVRAIAAAEGRTWFEIYDRLVDLGRKKCALPNDKRIYSIYLKGYPKINCSPEKGESRLTVEQFALNNPKGRFVVRTAGHLTAVCNGIIFDTWNCGNKCVYTAWRVA